MILAVPEPMKSSMMPRSPFSVGTTNMSEGNWINLISFDRHCDGKVLPSMCFQSSGSESLHVLEKIYG